MAINKKLIHFNTNANFSKENTAGNILDTSIVFVKDAKKIITHSNEYPAVNWGNIDDKFISSKDAVAGDVCFYDSQRDKLVLVRAAYVSATNYPSSRFTPIGVVVVPGTHNVYGDLSCGVMSLKEMNCDTPDTGSTSPQYIHWGQHDIDINTLPNFNYAPYVGTISSPGDSIGTITGQTKYPYMPSDIFTGTQCPHDTNSYYYTRSPSDKAAPSPYLTDGSRNPGYYQTSSPSSISNCLSDFNGITNTTTLINLATEQSDWKTASTITNNSGSGYSPAACCCWRFHTDGTKQGDWYLPAMGELYYVISRFKAINKAISKITTTYDSSYGVSVNTNGFYWASSEHSSNIARYARTDIGLVDYGEKLYYSYVRAFLRVKI